VRKHIISRLNKIQRQDILKNIDKIAKNELKIDALIANLSQTIYKDEHIDRKAFASLPAGLSEELLAYWLRRKNARDFDRKTINRLSIALRTSRAYTRHPVHGKLQLLVSQNSAEFSYTV
jgi:hypothetical protein